MIEYDSEIYFNVLSNLEYESNLSYKIISGSIDHEIYISYFKLDKFEIFNLDAFWSIGSSYSDTTKASGSILKIDNHNLELGYITSGTDLYKTYYWESPSIDLTGYDLTRSTIVDEKLFLPDGKSIKNYIAYGPSKSDSDSASFVDITNNSDLLNLNISGSNWFKFAIELVDGI